MGTMNRLQLLSLVLSAIIVSTEATAAADVTHHEVLDVDGKFVVFWKYDDDQIEFETHVETRGWSGLGLSPNGGMAGSDIVIGWVKDGQAHLTDNYAVGNSQPLVDESQDWELLSGYENDTHTVLRFKRKLQTCDDRDRVINKDSVRLLWAFNDADPDQDTGPSGPTYHINNRGTRTTMLLRTGLEGTAVPDNLLTHDLTMTNFVIPAQRTTYWCQIAELPKLDRKHHLVMTAPVITPGSEGMVHHMDFYHCHKPPNMTDIPHGHIGHECYTPNMPEDWNDCYMGGMIAAWAIGDNGFMMPEHAGYPIGEDDDAGYVLMEVHYDNPQLKEGVTDSSGQRIYYTPELRENDVGILVIVGPTNPLVVVPPGVEDYNVQSHCEQECLSAFLQERGEPIHIFANNLHGHLLSSKLRTRHIRNGVELPDIARDDNYDFNFQFSRILEEEVIVEQGDILMVECKYDSRNRDTVTYGGWSTAEEMCNSFLFYYPRMNMTLCISSPHPKNTLSFMGVEEIQAKYVWDELFDVQNISIVKPPNMSSMTYVDVIEGVTWNNRSVRQFNEHQLKGSYVSGCIGRPGTAVDWISLTKEGSLPDPKVREPSVDECRTSSADSSVYIHCDIFHITIFIVGSLSATVSMFL